MLQEDPGFPLLRQRPGAQIGATREALHGALLGGAEGDFQTPGGRSSGWTFQSWERKNGHWSL